jgi:hypothetical protein
LIDRLSNRQRRQLEGCYYFGCFAPLAFAVLAIMIVLKAVSDLIGNLTVRR